MRTLIKRRPSPALIVALLALFVALGGPAQAARMINGKSIRAGTVASKQIRDRSIAKRDLAGTTLRSARYTPNNSLSAAKLRRNAVTSTKVASGAITSAHVANGSLLAEDLATGSVASDQIVDGSIRGGDLATSAVTKSKLAGNSVGTSEVLDGGLTAKDLGSFTGRVPVEVGRLEVGECQRIDTPALAPLSGAQDIRDDVILIGRDARMPAGLDLAAQPKPDSATAFTVNVCNVGRETAATPFLGGSYTVPFISINP